MSDSFEQRRANIDNHVARLVAQERQVGAVFAIDGKVVGVDLFDDPSICANSMPKVVRSYALGAIGDGANEGSDQPALRDASELLHAIGLLDARRFPAIGLGEDWRMKGDDIQGVAIVHDDRAVHLCAFAT